MAKQLRDLAQELAGPILEDAVHAAHRVTPYHPHETLQHDDEAGGWMPHREHHLSRRPLRLFAKWARPFDFPFRQIREHLFRSARQHGNRAVGFNRIDVMEVRVAQRFWQRSR